MLGNSGVEDMVLFVCCREGKNCRVEWASRERPQGAYLVLIQGPGSCL